MPKEKTEDQIWLDSPEEAFQEWISSCNYAPRTVSSYERLFSKLLSFLSENRLTLKNVNNTVYRKFIYNLTPLQKTRKIYSKQFYSLFSYLSDIGVLSENPSKTLVSMEKGRSEKKLPVILSMDEQRRFLASIVSGNTWEAKRERTILYTLIGTGARCVEVSHLKIENVVLDKPAKIRLYGKGRKEREIPLTEDLKLEIEDFLETRGNRPGAFLFANRYGEPPAANSVYMMVRKTMDRAGLVKEKMGPHTLRHTFATRQFEAGIAPVVIRNWMGHSSLQTTLIYEHVLGTPGGVFPV